MNATEATRVEIDEKIREQPELLQAVNAATQYLEQQAEEVPPPAYIGWRYVDHDGKLLELTLRDGVDDTTRGIRRNYWTRWILDPVSQKICVLKAWGELLGKRSDEGMVRINHLITKLREELADGREDADGID
jgi:hypothetical protein